MLNTNYSGTKCPKCDYTGFEIVKDTPNGVKNEMKYLRCGSCKTIVNSMITENPSLLIRALAKELNIIL